MSNRFPFREYFLRTLPVLLILVTVLAAVHVASVHAQAPGESTLANLQRTVIPARDPVDLAVRLLGLKTIPTPVPPTQAHIYNVGDTRPFFVSNNDTGKVRLITGKLWYKTDHVYMWFEGDFQPDMNAVKQAADTFENKIYPTDHRYFGMEAS